MQPRENPKKNLTGRLTCQMVALYIFNNHHFGAKSVLNEKLKRALLIIPLNFSLSENTIKKYSWGLTPLKNFCRMYPVFLRAFSKKG